MGDFFGKRSKRRQTATMNQMNQMIQEQVEMYTTKQQEAQAQADAAAQAAQTAAYEPYQRLGTYGAGVTQLISGYPAQYKTGQTPSASPLQTALGVGTGLAGLYGGLTGKNPFGAIGQAVKSIFLWLEF